MSFRPFAALFAAALALVAAHEAGAAYSAASSRPQAMAGAVAALPGDVSAALWNPALLAFNVPAVEHGNAGSVSGTAHPQRSRKVTVAIAGIQASFANNALEYGEFNEFQDAGEPSCVTTATRDSVWKRVQSGGGLRGLLSVGGYNGFSFKGIGVGAREELSLKLNVSRDTAYLFLFSPPAGAAEAIGNSSNPTPTVYPCKNGQQVTVYPTCPAYITANTTYGVQITMESKVGNDYPITFATMVPLGFLKGIDVAAGANARILDGGRYEAIDAYVDFTTGSSVCEEIPTVNRNYVQFIHGRDGLGIALDLGLAARIQKDFMAGFSAANLLYIQRWRAVREVFLWDLNPKSERYLDFQGYSTAANFVDHDPVILRVSGAWLPARHRMAVTAQLEGIPAEGQWRLQFGFEKSWRFGSLRAGIATDRAYRITMLNLGGGIALGPYRWDFSVGMTKPRYVEAMGVTAGTSMGLWF